MLYSWPGNVRELQNGIERTFYAASGNVLEAQDFQFISPYENLNPEAEEKTAAEADPGSTSLKAAEQYRRVLLEADFDTEKAAEMMNMSRATFYRRCRKYGISPRNLAREYDRIREETDRE